MKSTMRILALAVIVMFAFMSCAQQPTQQMDAAKAAVQAVEGAKGMIYAKDELTKLKSDLQAALDEVTCRALQLRSRSAEGGLTSPGALARALSAAIPPDPVPAAPDHPQRQDPRPAAGRPDGRDES